MTFWRRWRSSMRQTSECWPDRAQDAAIGPVLRMSQMEWSCSGPASQVVCWAALHMLRWADLLCNLHMSIAV